MEEKKDVLVIDSVSAMSVINPEPAPSEAIAKAMYTRHLKQFPQGEPGTIIERGGRKYLVTPSGAQRRIE